MAQFSFGKAMDQHFVSKDQKKYPKVDATIIISACALIEQIYSILRLHKLKLRFGSKDPPK